MSTMLDELMMCHGAISLETVGSTNHSSFDQHSIQTLRRHTNPYKASDLTIDGHSNPYKASNLRPSLESQLDNFACNHNPPPPKAFSLAHTERMRGRVGLERKVLKRHLS